ncbi:MAG: ATP-binding cassette domain-containing protein, partial [Boseongicola sp.]|nr:ATP-binding cassette domain-containing protein [Boseongicola sp.]
MDEEVRALVDQLAFSLRLRRGKSFTLDAEETIPLQGITAITGPSGSGKTTLLRALSGLVNRGFDRRRIRFGTKSWDDVNISLPPEERRVGFVFQTPALFPQLTVEGNLAYGAKRRDVGNFDAIVEA